MPTVPDIHRRGTRAAQAAETPPLTVGTLWFVTDEGVTERWDGSAWEGYSGAGTGVVPPPTPGATPSTFLVSGGQVAWESAYTFRVSAADYYINAAHYTSVEAVATLSAAHATLDRLDVIALNTSGAVVVIAGTPSATPSEPSVDPAQYLKLAIVLVTHATVTPPTLQTITVYTENAGAPGEWAWTASGPAITIAGTTTPHAGTKAIDGVNVPAGVYAQGTSGAGTIDPNLYDHLLLFLRSKAAWNSSRGLLVTLRAAGVLVGAAVQIRRSGTFGFDSALTTDYQQVAIPLTAFAVPQGTRIDQVRLEDFGGAIGFLVDDVSFQLTGASSVGGGLSQDAADARYAPLVHASRHQVGGPDPIALDTLAAPTDITTLNATVSAHGLLRKLSGSAGDVLKGDGTWGAGGGGAPSAHATTHNTAGSDPITALSGSVITSGTIDAARLPTRSGVIGLNIDGGGSAITTGVKGFVQVPFACTITGWTLLSTDASATVGSIVVDVWKDTYAAYPPTVADTITASAKPTLSSANKNTSTTLTGWTTAITAGDVVGFSVTSVTTVTRIALSLTVSVP